MLVLSRKENDKIYFPTLGITLEMLRIRGNKARIGIDAPTEVPVIRHELSGLKSIEFTAEDDLKEKLSELIRAVRSRLDRASSELNQLHRQLEDEGNVAAMESVLKVFQELSNLDREAGEAIESPQPANARVLLVEDDANQRQLLSSFLQLKGFEVTTSNDGCDGLDYLSLHAPPDFVLVDMRMPRCDGPTFVTRVRSNAALSSVKLFAVSGTDPGTLGVATGPGGIDYWFPKPIDPEQLVVVVKRELGVATAV